MSNPHKPWTGDPLCYLGTPYTRYPCGLQRAFIDACKLAGRLLRTSAIKVYSPIAHTHPIAIHGDIPAHDHAIWLPFDALMMARCDILLVAHMDGWAESKGIAHEIEVFTQARKPIFALDPTTLMMARHSTPPLESPEDSALDAGVPTAPADADWTLQTR